MFVVFIKTVEVLFKSVRKNKKTPEAFRGFFIVISSRNYLLAFLLEKPNPNKPRPNKAIMDGSGTSVKRAKV